MAGAGLIAIKRRIKSINNTKKITKAIGLVATSKLRKARQKLELNNAYYSSVNEIMNGILADKNLEKGIYFKDNGVNKKLYIVITSDSGLCGGFNGNVIAKTLETISGDRENSVLITVGKKGRTYLKKFKIDSIAEFVEIPEIPTLKEVKAILEKALNLYMNKEISEINVVYTHFVSSVKQEAKVKKILPITMEEDSEQTSTFVEFEPDKNIVLEGISELYLKQTLLNLMLNSKTSEESARMTAMDGATSNANDLLDKLNLQYNRIRQSSITQEISEIVGGAQAQE
ncbi:MULTISPECIES: ATP synthase F1 subunit gamma [Clostridium]|uniref:ATP synthase gamma chain n=1 Tax=Clostridium novyi A str. 4570 TaxID=1444290 RepID=A0AA88ZS04_CLONO|nr:MULTISPECIES: ATP synthase F1 subunit gamma [Clostridium]KEH86379.1 ATP synthase F0F1 subunit gamma [Clostridium novyi A str. 4540]KEH91102.1 ATP synthase F0F1 subunit gamma [Clostridium novyi A str. BKT29909]KEH92346.1 ATP synthase F0F1 subunit gamma [Clostridium novyi A str. GD211209]KEH94751.1 ATP synthase F0F1 subunit gamma [Clostridium botulinum C/D str. It1]KGN02534.1 ATP synthase F0F1 subunit gamma [Clostridium novyi A str. 4570]